MDDDGIDVCKRFPLDFNAGLSLKEYSGFNTSCAPSIGFVT